MHLLLALLLQDSFERDGRTYEVRPHGAIGRAYRKREYRDEVAALLKMGSPEKPNVWKARFFIFKELDLGKTKRAFTDAEIATLRKVCDEFCTLVHAYSGGHFKFDYEVHVIADPLTKLSGGGDNHLAYPDVTDPLIGKLVPDDTDSVIVYWPHKDVAVWMWGGTNGGIYKGAGYSSCCVFDTVPLDDYVELTLHEWLHQWEWARGEQAGYGGLPDLHGSGAWGYRAAEVSRGWMDWYRDFLTVYASPEMWRTVRMRASTRPVAKFEGGFVREWQVSKSFPNEGCRGFDADPIGEATAVPRDWKVVASGDTLDLLPGENVVAYAHVYVRSDRDQPARLWIGSDDGLKVIFNGRELLSRHEHRGCAPDQDVVDVVLRKGWNRVLLKCDQGVGGWGLCLRISKPDGSKLDVATQAAHPGKDVVETYELPSTRYRWADVADDPWRKLPLVVPDGLAVGGPDTDLNATLDPAQEGVAWTRKDGRDWFLVRADLMPLLDYPIVGRTSRALFVCVTKLAFEPSTELDLVSSLHASPARVFPGDRVTFRMGDRTWERTYSETGWHRFAVEGQIAAVHVLEPFVVTVHDQSWDFRVEVRNQKPETLKFTGFETFDLAPGASRVFQRKFEAGLSLTAADKTWTCTLTKIPWRLAGPYDNRDRSGFDAKYAPEVGGEVRWKDLVPSGDLGRVDLRAAFEKREWVCAYAALDLEVEKDVVARLSFGSDDTLKVWVDADLVISEDVYRPSAPGQNVKDVTLKKGKRRLLVKVGQGEGGWDFLFSMTGTDGKPLTSVTVVAP